MRRATITIPVYLPDWLHGALQALRRTHEAARRARLPVNLLGDRDIEWSWISAHMPPGPGSALDVGPGTSCLALMAAQRGFVVTAVDLQSASWPYVHPRLRFTQGDVLTLAFPSGQFDLVINCSTIEHVGLAGRYGVTHDRPDGDLQAMRRLADTMRPGGIMLLTVPVGRDAVFPPYCRVYGSARLPHLLEGYLVETETFWVKDQQNRWQPSDRQSALSFEAVAASAEPLSTVYALGCFALRKPRWERGGDVHGGTAPVDGVEGPAC